MFRYFFIVPIAIILGIIWRNNAQLITSDPVCENVGPADCNPEVCRCPSYLPPAPLDINSPAEIPQIVVLSFDDAITLELYNRFYVPLFANRFNPPVDPAIAPCPIRGTFFIQHDYTNYSLVHELWRNGFEIASHSMTHRIPSEAWELFTAEEVAQEMVGVRKTAAAFARMPEADIKGVRVPFLVMSGNNYTRMMQDNGFLWDASRPTRQQMNPGLWPYTYDFVYEPNLFLDCPIPTCPSETFPGIWQVPINDLNDTKGIECAMLDQCNNRPVDKEEALELLRNNFNAHYNGTRSPFNLFTHASWFQGDWEHNYDALGEWLDEILLLPDVFVLPVGKLIEYVQRPDKLVDLIFNPAFACDSYYPTPPPRDCPTVTNCVYCERTARADGSFPPEVIMPVCGRCPRCFPNPTDHLGDTCGGNPIMDECTHRYSN